MSIILPQYVLTAIETLENAGYEAFCVGGAIRDIILGKVPSDFDITTNAIPETIMKLFNKTVPTGLKHGTVTVIIDGENLEITTYRSEHGYTDHRSPDSVAFLSSVYDDVMRRDFTINAILYNPKTGFRDPQGGMSDISLKLIRAVGEPERRFEEDALRIMRAFRFSAQLGFKLEENTLKAAVKLSETIESLSRERIFGEFKKIILSPYPQNANVLLNTGCFDFLNFNPNSRISLDIINGLPLNFALRFAFLCKNYSLNCGQILKNLKSDNETVTNSEKYSSILAANECSDSYKLKLLLNKYGLPAVKTVLESEVPLLDHQHRLLTLLEGIIANKEPYEIRHLLINGNDLLDMGFTGEEVGKALSDLLNICIKTPKLNTREELLKIALSLK